MDQDDATIRRTRTPRPMFRSPIYVSCLSSCRRQPGSKSSDHVTSPPSLDPERDWCSFGLHTRQDHWHLEVDSCNDIPLLIRTVPTLYPKGQVVLLCGLNINCCVCRQHEHKQVQPPPLRLYRLCRSNNPISYYTLCSESTNDFTSQDFRYRSIEMATIYLMSSMN